MRFVKEIEGELNNIEGRRGLRKKCAVNSTALRELLYDYERLDSLMRTKYEEEYVSLEHKLANILRALYAKNHDSERPMLLIMNILKPMIEKRVKEREIDAVFNRG